MPCNSDQPINFSFDLRAFFLIVYIYCFLMKFQDEPSFGCPPPASVPEGIAVGMSKCMLRG